MLHQIATATLAGSDYTAASGTVTIALRGHTTVQTFNVPVLAGYIK